MSARLGAMAETGAKDVLEGTPYQLIRPIGRGGMGEVFLARERESGTEVVVKVLLPELGDSPRLVERLRLEARALGALDHPNIVRVFVSGETAEGLPFLALECLTGSTLAEELRADRHPALRGALNDVVQVLSGLAAAHGLGLVHRDVKPSNVFAHRDPERGRVMKLLDFGVVKVLGDRGPMSMAALTTAGFSIGTPRYMSPEQARAGKIDARSDVYSVGLLLYRLVCGRGPFDDCRRDVEIVKAHLRQKPRPPSVYARHPLPPALDATILKALEKKPADRFQSAAELSTALQAIADTLVESGEWPEPTVVVPPDCPPPRAFPPGSTRPMENTQPTEYPQATQNTRTVEKGAARDAPPQLWIEPLAQQSVATEDTRIQFPGASTGSEAAGGWAASSREAAAEPPSNSPDAPGSSQSALQSRRDAASLSRPPDPADRGVAGSSFPPRRAVSPHALLALFIVVVTVGAWLVALAVD